MHVLSPLERVGCKFPKVPYIGESNQLTDYATNFHPNPSRDKQKTPKFLEKIQW